MWFVLQSVVMFAVIGSNIHYEWTPNQYLPGLIGAVLAYGATDVLNWLIEMVRTGRRGPPPLQADPKHLGQMK
jgi:hypothetical protein